MPHQERKSPRLFAALVGAVLAGAVWLLSGPLTVETHLEFSRLAGPALLQWSSGSPLDGAWLDPDASGRAVAAVPPAARAITLIADPGTTLPAPPRATIRLFGVAAWSTPVDAAPGIAPNQLSLSWSRAAKIAACALELSALILLGAAAAVWLRPRSRREPATAAQSSSVLPRFALAAVAAVHLFLAWRVPLFFAPDSMDYAVAAMNLRETGSFESFNTWRVPGLSVLLAPLVASWGAVSFLQAAASVLAAWLAGRTASRFAGGAWPAAAVLLAGLGPSTLLWSRYAMPEVWSMLVVSAAAWLATLPRRDSGGQSLRMIMLGAGLGLVLAAGCYLRANLLVLAVLAPLGLCVAAAGAGHLRRGLLAAAVAAGVCLGCLSPWLLRTHDRTGRWALSVGADFQRAQSLWDGGVIDPAQSRAFDLETSRRLRQMRERRAGPFEFLAVLDRSGLDAEPGLSDPWLEHNRRCAAVVTEALARRPAAASAQRAKAMSSLLGLHDFGAPGFAENRWWFRALTGGEGPKTGNFWNPPADYAHLPTAVAEKVFAAASRDTNQYRSSFTARAFAAYWRVARRITPLIVLCGLATLVVAIRGRRWTLAWLGLLPVAHAGAVAILLYTGIDRYQAPFWPVIATLACVGLSQLCSVLGLRRTVRSES